MKKNDLVNVIAEKAGLSKIDARKALDAVVNSIADVLVTENKFALAGFGTFTVSEKAARQGINPRTKEVINIPARKTVKFKAGVELTSRVNE
ncbi:MAG: HU family DNA-binding protein [Muribaculaceae bacterium]|nr:HU family DNA-binding protein [Muribaculaceae bacterium]